MNGYHIPFFALMCYYILAVKQLGELNMKKRISLILVLLLITAALAAGCSSAQSDRDNTVKDDVYANYETLKSDVSDAENNDAIIEYLSKWADKKDLYSKAIAGCGLVMSRPASDDYKNAESLTIQCPVNVSDKSETFKTAAIGLTALSDSKNHGKVTLIFTVPGGLKKLPAKYLKTDNIVALTERSGPRLFTGSASTAEYDISKTTTRSVPEGTKACKISISDCVGGDSANRDIKHANPIVAIGDALNSCRSAGMIIELSSFNGGGDSWDYPSSASAVIVYDDSVEDKLLTKLDSIRDDYRDKYLKSEPDMQYTVTPVTAPSKALSETDTSSIMNLMYTMKNGIYATTEDNNKGDILALTNVGYISTSGNKLDIKVFGRSIDKTVFKEMGKAYKDIAEITDCSFKIAETTPMWTPARKNTLADSMTIAGKKSDLDLTANSTFMKNDGAILHSAAGSGTDVISLGIDIQHGFEFTKTLITFIETQGDKTNDAASGIS